VLEEADAVDEVHREEPLAVLAKELVEQDEVRVDEVGEGPELLLQAVDRPRVDTVEGLQGDAAAALLVEGLVDDAERAASDLAPDREARVSRGIEDATGGGARFGLPGGADLDPSLFYPEAARKASPLTTAARSG
jgi:hypothetical protein